MSRNKGKEKEVELPSREELITLVEEINNVLALDPPIEIKRKTTDEEIVEMIKEQTEGNIYEIDFTPDPENEDTPYFSEESDALLEKLGVIVLEGAAAAEPEKEEKPKGKGKEKEEAPAKKKDEPKKDTKKADPAKKKEDKGPKYTRYHAFADTVKSGKTLSTADIDEKANSLYLKNDGSDNVEQQGRINDRCFQVLLALELGTLKDKKFTYTGK